MARPVATEPHDRRRSPSLTRNESSSVGRSTRSSRTGPCRRSVRSRLDRHGTCPSVWFRSFRLSSGATR